ncbi:MAG: two-component regulator propeller domain-containing protein [Bacteroidota bacterium]
MATVSGDIKRRYSFSLIIGMLCFLLHVSLTSAQVYHFENYSGGDGLLDSKVYTIVIDKEGYVWLGSLGGLTRFDGTHFINFTTEEGLSPGGVKTLYVDEKNVIWIGHLNGGITRYDHNTFERIPYSELNNTKDITAIIPDKEGSLWFTTYGNGAYRLLNPDAPIAEIEIDNYKGGRLSDLVFGGTNALDSTLFLITEFGIKQFLPDSNIFVNYLPEGLTKYFAKTCMHEDSKGNIWYGTQNGGLVKHEPVTGAIEYFDYKDGLETNYIWSIFEDSQGHIWTSNIDDRFVKGGITRIDGSDFKAFNKENGLDANQITCFAEDLDGNLLLGTLKNGFYVFKGEEFFTIREDEEKGLLSDQVWEIYQDEDSLIWFGTDGGISVYDPSKPHDEAFIKYFHAGNSLLHNNVRIIEPDNNNNLWIGTEGGGMYFYNRRTGRLTPHFDINTFIIPYIPIINAMVIDAENHLWIGTDQGLGYYEISSGKMDMVLGRGIAGNIISALYIDSEQNIWIGSQGAGVARFNPKLDTFEKIPALETYTPLAFLQDENGNIWVGTEGRGLLVVANDTIKKNYTTRDGLLSNLVNLLNKDAQNRIYVGTNKGLNRIDPGSERIQSFTTANGFVGIETKNNATTMDSKGRLWFGTINGVTCFSPDKERTIEQEPLTHISRMLVNLEEQKMHGGLKLHHSKKSIVFEFNCVDLTNPEMVE